MKPVLFGNCETHCGQLVKAGEELVEQFHQLLSAAGRRQLGEAHDVCKQNTAQQDREDSALVLTSQCYSHIKIFSTCYTEINLGLGQLQ